MRVIPHSYGQIQSGVCGRSCAHTSRTHAPVSISLSQRRDGKYARLAARIRFNGTPVPPCLTRVARPPRLYSFPPSSDSYFPPTSLRLPPSPLCTGYNATQPYITRRPSLSFSLRVCSLPLDRRSCVACVCVDTARGGENENSSRVRMLASGIQLERAIGPNGMKFLCGQTQERSRASFFSLAQPELPPIRTIFVQPESRVIEMASLFLRAYPERNEISLGECSFCSISHVERIDGISFFSGAGSSSFDLISNREGSEPPPPLTSFPGFTPEIFSIQLFPLCFLLSLSLTLFTVPPDILSSGTSEGEVSVLEGENATLSCKATGRPAPRVLWRREKSGSILMRGLHDPLIPGKILHFYLESSTLASVVPGDK